MAAGTFVILNRGLEKIMRATLDLDSHAWKVALCTQSWTPTADYAGTSGDARYSDLGAAQVSGTGYTVGGATLASPTVTRAGGVITFTAANTTWASATLTAKWAVIYSDTDTNKSILGYVDLDTGNAAGISPSNGQLATNWNASGIFTLSMV